MRSILCRNKLRNLHENRAQDMKPRKPHKAILRQRFKRIYDSHSTVAVKRTNSPENLLQIALTKRAYIKIPHISQKSIASLPIQEFLYDASTSPTISAWLCERRPIYYTLSVKQCAESIPIGVGFRLADALQKRIDRNTPRWICCWLALCFSGERLLSHINYQTMNNCKRASATNKTSHTKHGSLQRRAYKATCRHVVCDILSLFPCPCLISEALLSCSDSLNRNTLNDCRETSLWVDLGTIKSRMMSSCAWKQCRLMRRGWGVLSIISCFLPLYSFTPESLYKPLNHFLCFCHACIIKPAWIGMCLCSFQYCQTDKKGCVDKSRNSCEFYNEMWPIWSA